LFGNAIFSAELIKQPHECAVQRKMSDAMAQSAAAQPGFLGVESAREEVGITGSYWASLEAIAAWKRDAAHLMAQKLGRENWYAAYKTRICLVERDYDFSAAGPLS
jgi:heme-degrading monooxygenase HmoA